MEIGLKLGVVVDSNGGVKVVELDIIGEWKSKMT